MLRKCNFLDIMTISNLRDIQKLFFHIWPLGKKICFLMPSRHTRYKSEEIPKDKDFVILKTVESKTKIYVSFFKFQDTF